MSWDDPMDPESPAAWKDPEFAPLHVLSTKLEPRNRGVLPNIAWILWLFLAALCVGFWFDPLIGPLMLGALCLIAMTVGVVAAAMTVGMMGTVLFAIGDRVVAWIRRTSRWPED